jgi:hypothetical protein
VIHELKERWRQFASATAAALALWGLAAAHGYAWQLIWLPAAAAGATWPTQRTRTLDHCLRRLRRQRDHSA